MEFLVLHVPPVKGLRRILVNAKELEASGKRVEIGP